MVDLVGLVGLVVVRDEERRRKKSPPPRPSCRRVVMVEGEEDHRLEASVEDR